MALSIKLPQFKTTRHLQKHSEEERKRQWSSVRGLATPIWLREISAGLNALSDLPFNWDSYGSQPVSKEALLAARMIFSRLDISDHPKPHICAVAGGGV